MLIIGKGKKRRITIRLGFLWYWMKLLSAEDFDMATEVFCNLCYDLDVNWEAVQRAAKCMEEVMTRRKEVQKHE